MVLASYHVSGPTGDGRQLAGNGKYNGAVAAPDAGKDDMRKLKLVMVGNGMAGVRTLEELLKLAPDLYEITVFGAEPHPNYNRILLSPVLAGEQTLQDIVLNDFDWYSNNDVTLHAGKKIAKIDRVRRHVVTDDGLVADYDRLLLATGSNPFILPIAGRDLPGVLSYRDIQDTTAMIDAAAKYKNAVVIGGGLLGLEAANGLRARGMSSPVEQSRWSVNRKIFMGKRGKKFLYWRYDGWLPETSGTKVAIHQHKSESGDVENSVT